MHMTLDQEAVLMKWNEMGIVCSPEGEQGEG